ncbi:MAG: hypothetical protein KQA34_02695 [Candidatus Aenigmarchaeota archaeon]|nr:hypothetical protein [Candidatus Aenigmarchaeota archaeon]
MPIEIPTELLYILIFFLIIVAVILAFLFSGFDINRMQESISGFWDSVDRFAKKIFGEK